MKLLLKFHFIFPVLLLFFLAGCTASEKSARNERREAFYAQKAERKRGKKEVVKHKVGENTRLAKSEDKRSGRKNKAAKGKNTPATSTKSRTVATNRKYSSKEVAKVVNTARSFIGTPYRDAGTSRIGMDCSGLTMVSYQAIDLKLPRNSTEQSNFGKPVNINSIKEGDLVFFGMGSNKNRINHVGLVTEVKGKNEIMFIHSSTSLGVIENNLYSPYYHDRIVKACRPY